MDEYGKLIKMLGSPNDHEVLAAARALDRKLKSAGRDFHWLALQFEKKTEGTRAYDAFVNASRGKKT